MPGETMLGEEYKVYVDVDHNAGGAWGTANWVELKAALDVGHNPGIISAEFPFRGVAEVGAKRSKRRNQSLDLSVGFFKGDTAFDRLYAAAIDKLNAGAEILHLMIVEGDREDAGNFFTEADYVVTEMPKETPTGEGASVNFTLKKAADSPNDSIADGLTT